MSLIPQAGPGARKNRATRAGALFRVFMAFSVAAGSFPPLRADDVWTDRRRAARARFSSEKIPLSPRDRLAAVLPSPEYRGTGPFPGAPAAWSAEALPRWLRATIGYHGDVREIRLPTARPRDIVIHILDVHDVPEAQRNISGLLEQITASLPGPVVVGLEGAAGPFDLAPYRNFTTPAAVARAADLLVEANVISGPEQFGLTTRSPARLVGVEDPRLYLENVAALREAFAAPADAAAVAAVGRRVEGLKDVLFSPELRALDRAVAAQAAGTLSLGDYAAVLVRGVPAENRGPQTRLFQDIREAERSLNMARVAEERRELLERLTPRLTEGETQRLVNAGLEHRVGRASYASFHRALAALAAAHGVPLSRYPAYAVYERLEIRAESLDGPGLMAELAALAVQRRAALLTSEDQRALAAVIDDFSLLGRLCAFTLLPQDIPRLRARRPELERLSARVTALVNATAARSLRPSDEAVPPLEGVFRRHERFYRLAERRNVPLVERLWAARAAGDENPGRPRVSILVAGGFHAPGLRDALLRRGAGYIALSPRFTSPDTLPHSLDAFRPGASPVDRLWRADRSTLRRPLVLARAPLASNVPQVRSLVFAMLAAVALGGLVANQAEALPVNTTVPVERVVPPGALEGLGQWITGPGGGPTALAVPPREVTVTSGPDGSYLTIPLFFPGERRRRQANVRLPLDGNIALDDVRFSKAGGWRVPSFPRVLAVLRNPAASPWWVGLKRGVAGAIERAGLQHVLSLLARSTRAAMSFGLSELGRVATWSGWPGVQQWAEDLRNQMAFQMERKWLAAAEKRPFGLSMALLFSMAMRHRVSWETPWSSMLLEALGSLGPGVPSVEVLSSEMGDPRTNARAQGEFWVTLRLAGAPRTFVFVVSDAPVLQEAAAHPLIQVASSKGRATIALQALLFNNDDSQLLRLALRHLVRELVLLQQNPDLSLRDAHRQAEDDLEEAYIRVTLAQQRYLSACQTYDNGLLTRPGLADVAVTPDGVVELTPYSSNSAISAGSEDPFPKGFGLTSLLFSWTEPPASSSPEEEYLKGRLTAVALGEKLDSLERLSLLLSAGDRPVPREALLQAILSLVSTVGHDTGRRTARDPGAPGPAESFPPLGRTVLAMVSPLSLSGEERQALAQALFARFSHAFGEGISRTRLLSSGEGAASPGSADGPTVGVFHLRGAVRDSSSARELLETLNERRRAGTLGSFVPVLLLDGPGLESATRAGVITALQSRWEAEFGGLSPAARVEGEAALGRLALLKAQEAALEVGGKISLHRLMARWPGVSVGQVQIFTADPDRILQDAPERDAAGAVARWVIYLIAPRGLVRLSASMEDAAAEERLRQIIASHA